MTFDYRVSVRIKRKSREFTDEIEYPVRYDVPISPEQKVSVPYKARKRVYTLWGKVKELENGAKETREPGASFTLEATVEENLFNLLERAFREKGAKEFHDRFS